MLKNSQARQLAAKAAYEESVLKKESTKEESELVEKSRGVLVKELETIDSEIKAYLDTKESRRASRNYSSIRYYDNLIKDNQARQASIAGDIERLDEFESACEEYKAAVTEVRSAHKEALTLKEAMDAQRKSKK